MAETPDTGGRPEHVAECTACGRVYPVRSDADGELRPIGTDGACVCGNETFAALGEAEETGE
ncbi:hypothetical protein MBEHAL_0931 [Halarchaeum acidiphilum MH1-52-1]|uniref:Uncharacterized protein n=1 Tax=Halarchaeum acidiphilum MH1-52-1 TaxID=1261545 RepID=U2YEF1_9EURY|nr:hypothetical protein [Halarchaeum acidiphilum]GAD52171.1 hypothetical protein MBEHAL_0931 [Halarchaeum acidiphilum MH1-52-1]